MRRRLSQLQLATAAEVSARHLSFVETGRARPSREMVIHLSEHLDIPFRDRNALLLAAGFAPLYQERPLSAPEMDAVRDAVEMVVTRHEPYPAIAVDRHWNVVMANDSAMMLVQALPAELLGPPLNVYRVSLHPDGMAAVVTNFDEYALHLVARLRHEVSLTGDAELASLLEEVECYPTVQRLGVVVPSRGDVVLPMRLRLPVGELALFSIISTFGTPVDVTVSELAIESFFPADDATDHLLRNLRQ